MKKSDPLELYSKYYISKQDERRGLFEKLTILYKPKRGMYPGSFVHITPSFFIRDMTYIDSDSRISRFFSSQAVSDYIRQNANYTEEPIFQYFKSYYSDDLPILLASYDILFSFYGGFISRNCKRYLANEGILVANNSHGDVSLAYVDNQYTLIAVIKRNGDNFTISDKSLSSFCIKKDGTQINEKKVLATMRGENFTKKAYAYIFKFTAD